MATSIETSASFGVQLQEAVFRQSSVTQLSQDSIIITNSGNHNTAVINTQPRSENDNYNGVVTVNAQPQSENDNHNNGVVIVNAQPQGERGRCLSQFFESDDENDVPDAFSENRGMYWCQCGKDFKSTSQSNRHKKHCAYDDKVGGYRCKCGVIFKYLSDYTLCTCNDSLLARTEDVPQQSHAGKIRKMDVDGSCSEVTDSSVDSTKIERKRKRNELVYECPISGCARRYKTERFFLKHVQEKHPNYKPQPINAYSGHVGEKEEEEREEEDDSDDYSDADLVEEPFRLIGQYLTDQEIDLEVRAASAIKLLELAANICDGEAKKRVAIRLAFICETLIF